MGICFNINEKNVVLEDPPNESSDKEHHFEEEEEIEEMEEEEQPNFKENRAKKKVKEQKKEEKIEQVVRVEELLETIPPKIQEIPPLGESKSFVLNAHLYFEPPFKEKAESKPKEQEDLTTIKSGGSELQSNRSENNYDEITEESEDMYSEAFEIEEEFDYDKTIDNIQDIRDSILAYGIFKEHFDIFELTVLVRVCKKFYRAGWRAMRTFLCVRTEEECNVFMLKRRPCEGLLLKFLDHEMLLLDHYGYVLLIGVCTLGYPNALKRLLNKVDPSECENNAFSVACEHGRLEVVKTLLNDERVSPHDYENLAIRMAVQNNHFEIVNILLNDERVDPSAECNFAIRVSSANGHTRIVNDLLKHPKVDPSAEDQEAFLKSVENGHFEVVRLLLADSRVDPSVNNNLALFLSAENGYTEIFELLITDSRVDPCSRGNMIMETICREGFFELFQAIQNDGRLDPSVNNNESLVQAAEMENLEIVKELIKDERVLNGEVERAISRCRNPTIINIINNAKMNKKANDDHKNSIRIPEPQQQEESPKLNEN